MNLRMWMLDVAREQTPTYEYLDNLCKLSLDAGYNALGLYLEHRFAYPSVPWVHGRDCLTPETIQKLQLAHPSLQLIPFVNLLGHFEGFLYSEPGQKFACERFKGLQADPTLPEFVSLCHDIIKDTLKIFNSSIIHIGGDETQQLGAGAAGRRVSELQAQGHQDGKAVLYGEHFGALAKIVSDAGRIPAVWGDMFVEHPSALESLPAQTMIFDWQYFKSSEFTAKPFQDRGFKTVYCPAIHTYNALWCHLAQSEQNVAEHAEAAVRLGAEGVCITTWECGLMGNYNTLLPAIRGFGALLTTATAGIGRGAPLQHGSRDEDIAIYSSAREAPYALGAYLKESESLETWAREMGIALQDAGGCFEFGGIRSGLKCRLLLYSNPFLLWLRQREDLCGRPGQQALEIAQNALYFALDSDYRGVCQLLTKSIEFVQFAESSSKHYSNHRPGDAAAALAPCRQIFEDLEKIAVATQINSCGSRADSIRCQSAKKHVEEVIRRIKQYGDGSLGYLPSFETICHPKFVPHDQANWWLINTWANE